MPCAGINTFAKSGTAIVFSLLGRLNVVQFPPTVSTEKMPRQNRYLVVMLYITPSSLSDLLNQIPSFTVDYRFLGVRDNLPFLLRHIYALLDFE